jgi:hypothetical protein
LKLASGFYRQTAEWSEAGSISFDESRMDPAQLAAAVLDADEATEASVFLL